MQINCCLVKLLFLKSVIRLSRVKNLKLQYNDISHYKFKQSKGVCCGNQCHFLFHYLTKKRVLVIVNECVD